MNGLKITTDLPRALIGIFFFFFFLDSIFRNVFETRFANPTFTSIDTKREPIDQCSPDLLLVVVRNLITVFRYVTFIVERTRLRPVNTAMFKKPRHAPRWTLHKETRRCRDVSHYSLSPYYIREITCETAFFRKFNRPGFPTRVPFDVSSRVARRKIINLTRAFLNCRGRN